MVRIGGRLRTVQRAAWEFTHGPLPDGVKVLSCPVERACVRVEHLRLLEPNAMPVPMGRRGRSTGTKREVQPGVWELAVSRGPGPSGMSRRRWERFAGTADEADARLARLAESVRLPDRMGDLRVRELLDRYLTWTDEDGGEPALVRRRRLVDEVIEPALGRRIAILLDEDDIDGFLRAQHAAGLSDRDVRDLRGVLHDAYRWAQGRRWISHNPVTGVAVRRSLG